MKIIYNEDDEKILVDNTDEDSGEYEILKKSKSEEESKDMNK